jgi:ABC-type multidrug transport system fused ATPase/permease subunit
VTSASSTCSFAYGTESRVALSVEDGGNPDVLSDFNLHLRSGETVALVGRTGSGKSTVARVLARFYDVTDGAVYVDGHDVRDLTLTSLRANIGVVLDEPFLFSVSIRDNIAYGGPTPSRRRSRLRPGGRRRRLHPPPSRRVRHRGR